MGRSDDVQRGFSAAMCLAFRSRYFAALMMITHTARRRFHSAAHRFGSQWHMMRLVREIARARRVGRVEWDQTPWD